MTKGKITESTMDILDTMVTDGAFWAGCVLAYDKACSNEIIRCTADGVGKIDNCLILPRLLTGQTWGHPLSCKVSAIGNDDKDKAKPAINALASHLREITNFSAHSVAPLALVTTSASGLNGLDLDGVATRCPFLTRAEQRDLTSPPRTRLSMTGSATE
jgi:hypothetical protein